MGNSPSNEPVVDAMKSAIATCEAEAHSKCEKLNTSVLDEVIGRLLDSDISNDDIGTETKIMKFINDAGDHKDALIKYFESKGVVFEKDNTGQITKIEGDEDDKFDIDEIGLKNQETIFTQLKKLDNAFLTQNFDDFKKILEDLNNSEEGSTKNILNLAVRRLGFKGEIDKILKDENLKDAFNKLAVARNAQSEKSSAEVKRTTETLLPEGIGIPQLQVLNPVLDIDTKQLLEDAGKDKEQFMKLLAHAYIEKFRELCPVKAKQTKVKKKNKATDIADMAEAGATKLATEAEQTINNSTSNLPLFARNLLGNDATSTALQQAIENGDPLPSDINEEYIFNKIEAQLGKKDITMNNLLQAFEPIKQVELKTNKEKKEFVIAKMKTVEGSGYEDSERATKYKTYVLDKGATALDFGEWIAQQNIPFMERFGAMLKKLLGPFLKMIREFSGKEKKEKPSKLDKILEGLEGKIKEKATDEIAEATEKVSENKLDEFLYNSKNKWDNIKIKELSDKTKSPFDFDKESAKEYLTKDSKNTKGDIEFLEKVLGANDDTPLAIARIKGFSMDTLGRLHKAEESGIKVEELKKLLRAKKVTDDSVKDGIGKLEKEKEEQESKKIAINTYQQPIAA